MTARRGRPKVARVGIAGRPPLRAPDGTSRPPPLLEENDIEAQALAAAAAHLADLKKAEDIRVYDVCDQIKVADYFVVATGTSRPHVRAILDELHVRLKAAGRHHARAEGADTGWWVLLDYGDVVVHVLQPEAREFYGLDSLYEECELLDWSEVELPELPDPNTKRSRAS